MSQNQIEVIPSAMQTEADPKQKSKKPAQEKEIDSVSFFELFRFVRKIDYFYMFLGAVAASCDGVANPLFALFFGDIADSFTGGGSGIIDAASKICLKFVYVGIGSFFASYIGYVCWTTVGETLGIEIRKRYFKSLLNQNIAFYDSINPNELSTKISEECFNIQQAIGEKVSTFFGSMATLVAGLVIGYIKGWQLALVLSSVIPVMGITGAVFVVAMQKLTKINTQAFTRAGAVSEEVLNAIRTVVSLGGQEREANRYEKILKENGKLISKYSVYSGLAISTLMCTMFCVYALAFFIGSIFIKNEVYNPTNDGPYKVGDVLTIFFAIMMASTSPTRATPSLKAFAIAKTNAARAYKIIDRKSEIPINDPKGLKPTSIEGNIRFDNVTFAYPSKKERIIINGVSFEIKKNQKTAFVGESGCGKTTCMQLIERFYDIENGNGSVDLDGNNIKDLNLKWMRDNIGYVGQEPVLFATSIKENLMMAKEDATEAEIWDALKKANAAEFVEYLPEKLNTFVGNSGTQLSGGQKQRLAIARAILKNPKILLLDEATSALDRKNEMEIQKTLDSVSEGRTTIVIAHRLSTIINSDHIIVFDGGNIVEEGTHEELVAKQGKYYALQHLQLQTQEKEEHNKHNGQVTVKPEQVTIGKTNNNQTIQATQPQSSQADKQIEVKVDSHIPSSKQQHKVETKEERFLFSKKNVLARLFLYSQDDIPLIAVGMIGAMGYGTCQPLIAPILANILFVLAEPSRPDFSSKTGLYSGLFLVLAAMAYITFLVQHSLFSIAAERLARKVRLEVFRKYVKMPIGWFDDPHNSPGALGSKLSTDATLLNTLTSSVFGFYMQAVSAAISGVTIAFFGDWRLAMIGIGVSPFQIIAAKIRASISQKLVQSSDDSYQESIAFASEAINNARTVASFATEEKLMVNYSKKLDEPLRKTLNGAHRSGIVFGIGQFINFGVNAFMFYISAVFIDRGYLDFKDMMMSIQGIMFACMGIGNCLQFAPDMGNAVNAAINIFRILDTKPAIDIDDPNQTVRTPIKGDIEFRNVWFKYPSREKQIFQNFNLKIKASQKVAFVGPSGCGKSTILALLQRFYDVDQGEILIDGVNIKEYDLKHLRGSYGVVSQEPVLFNGTIEENIKYAKPNATETEMREAATKACAIGFIESNQFDVGDEALAAKYGTGFQRRVGPKGSQMSGGQKQRIAIARAILTNPSVLILDEATSALDAENEKAVQEALDKIMDGKTSLIVAHRISTIKDADEILVFSDGQIIERGNYHQLNDMKGVFYKLERGLNLGSHS